MRSFSASFVTYPTGNEASQRLQADTSLAEILLPLASVMPTTRWIRDLFVDDHQYALFGYVQAQYLAQLVDFGAFINEDGFKVKLKDVPPFDSSVKATVRVWREFFRTTGSHIITGTKYGARFQLVCRSKPLCQKLHLTSIYRWYPRSTMTSSRLLDISRKTLQQPTTAC